MMELYFNCDIFQNKKKIKAKVWLYYDSQLRTQQNHIFFIYEKKMQGERERVVRRMGKEGRERVGKNV